jgi:hypothetical protein
MSNGDFSLSEDRRTAEGVREGSVKENALNKGKHFFAQEMVTCLVSVTTGICGS